MSDLVQPDTQSAQVFQQALATCVARGWQARHIDTASRTAVLYSPGGKCNHILHLLLAIFTLGLWIPVWILMAATTRGPKSMTLTINESGLPHYSEPLPPGAAGLS